MLSLERAYQTVRYNILTESFAENLETVSDKEIINSFSIPDELRKYFIPGSGKLTNANSDRWGAEFYIKLPLKDWTDGLEDEQTIYDYIEQEIKKLLPSLNTQSEIGSIHSYAVVVDDKSDENWVVVRCALHGNLGI